MWILGGDLEEVQPEGGIDRVQKREGFPPLGVQRRVGIEDKRAEDIGGQEDADGYLELREHDPKKVVVNEDAFPKVTAACPPADHRNASPLLIGCPRASLLEGLEALENMLLDLLLPSLLGARPLQLFRHPLQLLLDGAKFSLGDLEEALEL